MKLADVVTLKRGKTYKSALLGDEGIPLLGLATIDREGGFRHDNFKKYAGDADPSLIVRSGEIYASLKDVTQNAHLLGSVARLPMEISEGRLTQDTVLLKVEEGTVDPSFLYWVLRAPQTRDFFKSFATGTTNLGLAREDFLSLALPEITAERRAFSRALDNLERLIELNRRTNETLEAMAKALFKSWFVDFDPVRAKAEGRPTGLPSEISNLFPDSFEDSELGEIPSGWRALRFSNCDLQIESGRRPKGGIDKNLKEGVASIGAESIAPVGHFDYSKTKWVDFQFADSTDRGWIQNYDVALYKDGGRPGEFRPRTALYGDNYPFRRAMVNEHVFLLRSAELGQFFLYQLFCLDTVLEQLIQRGSSKAAQPGLNQADVLSCSFVFPKSPHLLQHFNSIGEAITRRQLLIGKQSKSLEEIRDALLPKLISGELRIPDAEKMLEEVGV